MFFFCLNQSQNLVDTRWQWLPVLTLLYITQSQGVPEGLTVFVGRDSTVTTEEFELKQRLFDKEKWCLFRPTGGCKGKLSVFVSGALPGLTLSFSRCGAKDPVRGRLTNICPYGNYSSYFSFPFCLPVLTLNIQVESDKCSCNTINKSICPPVFSHLSPSTS